MRTNFQMIMDVKDYTPKDEMVTSIDEIRMLEEHFGLEDMNLLELQNLRDMVVLLFSGWMKEKRSGGEIESFFKLSHGMQSITAVIDNAKWVKGCEN